MYEHDYKKYPELTNTQLDTLQFSSPHEQITDDFFAKVVKVHDGDTITLRTTFRDFDFPLRIVDIDAPELNEPKGHEVKKWLESELMGKNVIIGINPKNRVGKYGRLLGTVWLNGLNIGSQMIRLGKVKPFGLKNEGEPEPINKILRQKWD